MPFQKVEAEKLSSAVVRQIESLILRGLLRPGERLPAERDLAVRLGVSRPSLRDALATLQEQGLLSARAGSGIYVADVLGSAFSPALIRLFRAHDDAVFDYITFRRDIESLAAERAAGCDECLLFESGKWCNRSMIACVPDRPNPIPSRTPSWMRSSTWRFWRPATMW